MPKRCCRCKQVKDLSDFGKNKSQRDGLMHYCKPCAVIASGEHRKRNMSRDVIDVPDTATCTVCHVQKPSSEFHRDSGVKSGLSNRCKDCGHAKAVEYIQRVSVRQKNTPSEKYCTKCHVLKRNSEFYKNSNAVDGLSSHCKTCYAEYERSERRRVVRLKYLRGNGRVRNQNSWHNYWSNKTGVEFDFHDFDWEFCLKWWSRRCAYCGAICDDLFRDHFIPVAVRGSFTVDNIVPACIGCNSSKSDNNPYTWCHSEQLIKIHDYFDAAIANHSKIIGDTISATR